MCALEKRTSSSDAAVTRARESLQALLRTSSPALSEISIAVEALETLKLRLQAAQRARLSLREATRSASASAAANVAHTERLDSEIIRAKLEAGELLTERDTVARDLARARRTLERLDESVKEMRESEDVGEGKTGEMEEREDEARMTRNVADELERMRLAQKGLVEVVEEINKVRKRREELQEKVKKANEEW